MRWMLAAAAAFGLVSAPATAGNPMFNQDFGTAVSPTLAGHIELGVGPEDYSRSFGTGSESSSHALLEGAGRVNIPLGGRWNFEGEATARTSWDSNVNSSTVGVYAHLWTMFPSSALGVLGGVSAGDLVYPLPFVGVSSLPGETYTAGVEGEAYLNRVTLGGQVTFSTTRFDTVFSTPDYHSWQVRGYAGLYLDPETKIVGDVKYTDPVALSIVPSQFRWDFVASAEHRFAGRPWSIWASGSYSTFSSSNAFNKSGDQWSVLVGFRLFMDEPGSTLYKHDREVPFKYDNQLRLLAIGIL